MRGERRGIGSRYPPLVARTGVLSRYSVHRDRPASVGTPWDEPHTLKAGFGGGFGWRVPKGLARLLACCTHIGHGRVEASVQ